MHIDSHVREVYADMHQSGGVQHGTRYGEPYFWGYYFIVSSALMAVHHMKLWANIVRRKQIGNTVKDNMKDLWVSKVRKEKFYSLKDFFVQGSDIENNFGILIAIKEIQYTTKSSPYIAMYEARSSTSIPVAAWSHPEQPVQHIKAIQSLLAKHRVDIPIYAIEGTEKYWAQKPFSVLVGSKSK